MSADKWVVGYMADGGVPPKGTILERHDGALAVADGQETFRRWRVLVPPPAPSMPWRRVVVEVRGGGADADVRFIGDGAVFDESLPIFPSVIAHHGHPAPAREKVESMLDDLLYAFARHRLDANTMRKNFLNHVCGKEGA